MRVECDRRLWRAFVRRAIRRYPKEYIEAAYGFILKDRVLICDFGPIEHTATKTCIVYDPEDIDKDGPLRYLGSIHSHPYCDECAPSEADWRDAAAQDEATMGVLAIWPDGTKKRTRGVFWPQTQPLDINLTDS